MEDGDRRRAHRRHALPAVLDDQRVVHPATRHPPGADLFPRAFTLDNYAVVLQDQLPYLGTSLLIGFGTVLLTLLISAPAAYALSTLFVPGRKLCNFLLIVAQMIPAVVMALGFYTIYCSSESSTPSPG